MHKKEWKEKNIITTTNKYAKPKWRKIKKNKKMWKKRNYYNLITADNNCKIAYRNKKFPYDYTHYQMKNFFSATLIRCNSNYNTTATDTKTVALKN